MNLPTIKNSCTSAGLAAIENSSGDIDALQKAIQTAASSADVDARFILAVVVSPKPQPAHSTFPSNTHRRCKSRKAACESGRHPLLAPPSAIPASCNLIMGQVPALTRLLVRPRQLSK